MEVAPVSDHVVEIKEGMKVPFFALRNHGGSQSSC
jgi:hypothetical protein